MSTILVVDDSQVERLLTEALLVRRTSHRVFLAENGVKALDELTQLDCDVVVTDLVMPEMDGAQLTRELRRRYPEIPVIVMTAFGNESTALEAIEAGAASYVPKSQRAERLLETVERVAERAVVNRTLGRLGRCMLEYHGRYSLENDLHLIRLLVEQSQQLMAGIGLGDPVERIRIGEALEEALLNAMYHGNLEIGEQELIRVRNELDDHLLRRFIEERCADPALRDRKIIFVMHLTADEVRFVIRDQGAGFSTNFATGNLDSFGRGGRRGLMLMHSLMDEIRYNDAGNELTMCRRIGREEPSPRTIAST